MTPFDAIIMQTKIVKGKHNKKHEWMTNTSKMYGMNGMRVRPMYYHNNDMDLHADWHHIQQFKCNSKL